MRIILENETYGLVVTVDRPGLDDGSIGAVVHGLVRPALLAAGYFQSCVDNVLDVDEDAAVDEMNDSAGL